MSLITSRQEKCVKGPLKLIRTYTLIFFPDWFVTQKQIDLWYDDDYDDEAPRWSKGYQKYKAQK